MSVLTRPTDLAAGLLLKRLVLLVGGTYLAMVWTTNAVNFLNSIAGTHPTFLSSGNNSCIATIEKIYALPSWFDEVAVLGAVTVEGIGAVLFFRALIRYRGNGAGATEAYPPLAWNIGVWFAFIAGTEFFIAYPPEAPFRELLGLGLSMTLVVALVPDAPGPGPTSDG